MSSVYCFKIFLLPIFQILTVKRQNTHLCMPLVVAEQLFCPPKQVLYVQNVICGPKVRSYQWPRGLIPVSVSSGLTATQRFHLSVIWAVGEGEQKSGGQMYLWWFVLFYRFFTVPICSFIPPITIIGFKQFSLLSPQFQIWF